MPAAVDLDLATAFEMMRARLIERFGQIEPEIIDGIMRHAAAEFADAPIRLFVPVFVERDCVHQLEALMQTRRQAASERLAS